MKRFSLLTVLLTALAGCAPMNYANPVQNLRDSSINEVGVYASSVKDFLHSGKTESEAIEAGKLAVTSSLKDPDSAKFRNTRLVAYLQGAVICGEVNGKNSYGGYAGFTRFAAGIQSATLEDSSSRYPDINAAANAGIDLVCR